MAQKELTYAPVLANDYRLDGYAPRTVQLRAAAMPVASIAEGTDEHGQFLDVIDQLPGYMGVRTALDEKEILTIYVFIREHFGALNPVEIVRAFSMAAAGQLYRESANGQLTIVEAETYQAFHLPYVGKILKAYTDTRTREALAWERSTQAARKRIAQPAPVAITPAQVIGSIARLAKRGDIIAFCDWNAAFLFLQDRGMITMTIEAKHTYMLQVKKAMHVEAMQHRVGGKINLRIDEDTLAGECRKRLVMSWIQSRWPNAKPIISTILPEVNLNQPTNGNTATETTIGHTDAISEDSNNAVRSNDERPAGRMDTQGKTTGDSAVPKPEQPAGQTKPRTRSGIATTGL